MTPLVAFAALLFPLAYAPADDGPGTEEAFTALGDDGVQDLVILGETRPVFLRLRVRIGDRPFRLAWDEGIKSLHHGLDRDGDGRLTVEETDKGELDSILAPTAPAGSPMRGRMELDANKDGTVSLEELSEAFRAIWGPFRLHVDGPSDRRTDTLFDHLDRDKDGQLNRSELETLVGSLRKLDRDADELIDAGEVALITSSPTGASTPVMTGRPARDTDIPPVVELAPGESPVRLSRLLIKKYDTGSSRGAGKKDAKLSPEEFAISAASFAEADRNRDNLLNAEELRESLTEAPRDAILDVSFSPDASGRASAVVRGGDGGPPSGLVIRQVAAGAIEVDVGLLRLDIHVDDGAGEAEAARKRFRALFDAADADVNGYLERDELSSDNGQTTPLAAIFKALDGDGDGKVYPRDLDGFVASQAAAARARLTLTASNEGRAIFGILDLDRDRRLGAREMLEAASRVSACDRDEDGRITPEEIPHHIRLELTRGDLSTLLSPRSGDPAVAASTRTNFVPRPPRQAAGPAWFRKMDRNRDGDVSRREFLGSREQFDRLDRDGDGLLAPDEAEAATSARRTEE